MTQKIPLRPLDTMNARRFVGLLNNLINAKIAVGTKCEIGSGDLEEQMSYRESLRHRAACAETQLQNWLCGTSD